MLYFRVSRQSWQCSFQHETVSQHIGCMKNKKEKKKKLQLISACKTLAARICSFTAIRLDRNFLGKVLVLVPVSDDEDLDEAGGDGDVDDDDSELEEELPGMEKLLLRPVRNVSSVVVRETGRADIPDRA